MMSGIDHHQHIDEAMLKAVESFRACVYQIEMLAYLNLLFMVSFLSRLIILRKIGRSMDIVSLGGLADTALFATSLALLQWIYQFNCIFVMEQDIVKQMELIDECLMYPLMLLLTIIFIS